MTEEHKMEVSTSPQDDSKEKTFKQFMFSPAGVILVLILCAIYGISPVDLVPEGLLGPIGLIDDAVVGAGGLSYLLYALFKKK